MFSSRSCTLLKSSSTLRWPVELKKVSTMRSRWRVALRPRSAIHSLSRVRASAGVEASAGRARTFCAGVGGRAAMGSAGPAAGGRLKLILKFNVAKRARLSRDPALVAGEGAPLLLRTLSRRAGCRIAAGHAHERLPRDVANVRVGIAQVVDEWTGVAGGIVAVSGKLRSEGAELRLRRGEVRLHVVAYRLGRRA